MKEKLTVLNPIGRVAASESKIAPRLQDLSRKRVAIIDNQKENADVVLSALKDILSSQYEFQEIFYFKKKFPAEPADFLEEILPKCDLVINGVGH